MDSSFRQPECDGRKSFSKSGPVINDVLVNTSGTNQIVTYSVTPTGTNGCTGQVFTVDITVKSKPVFTGGSSPALCSNIGFDIDPQSFISNGMTSNSFTWTSSYQAGLTNGAEVAAVISLKHWSMQRAHQKQLPIQLFLPDRMGALAAAL
ncbi:MAG: PKD-like domain-containing protein [Bacteroidota bacterium]